MLTTCLSKAFSSVWRNLCQPWSLTDATKQSPQLSCFGHMTWAKVKPLFTYLFIFNYLYLLLFISIYYYSIMSPIPTNTIKYHKQVVLWASYFTLNPCFLIQTVNSLCTIWQMFVCVCGACIVCVCVHACALTRDLHSSRGSC